MPDWISLSNIGNFVCNNNKTEGCENGAYIWFNINDMSHKITHYCDKCNKEYIPDSYGITGSLKIDETRSDSCKERYVAKYDLCGPCLSKIKAALNTVLNNNIEWKQTN